MNILLRVAVTLFLLAAWGQTQAETLAGRWEGSIRIPDRESRLIVDLTQEKGKDWSGSIIIPGLGVKGAPLTDLAIANGGISFAIKGALASPKTGPARFKGKVTSDGQLTGDFLQAGNTAPFTLEKTGPSQVELPPKSTAIARDFNGVWKGDYEMDGYPRHVTLTLASHENGPATAKLVIVGKRTNEPPIDLVTEEGGYLTIQSQDFGITYEGRLQKEGHEIGGTFALGPSELPLVLGKTP